MIKTLPLQGLKSVYALNAFMTLLFGLATEQRLAGQDFEETYANFEALPIEDKAKQLRHALQIVNLQKEDMLSLLAFAQDKNGIAFTEASVKQMPPGDILDAMLAVCLELAKIKPRTLSEDVKKNCPVSA